MTYRRIGSAQAGVSRAARRAGLLACLAAGLLPQHHAGAAQPASPAAQPLPSERQAPGGAAAARTPCRLPGLATAALCGSITRPEDPDHPEGRQLRIGYAVVPALATPALPDPVVVLAGGPGQSATALAGPLSALFATLNARRDLVFVDQRGTGRSGALNCTDEAGGPLADALDLAASPTRLRACLVAMRSGPADLRQYATWIAIDDFDAVRAALGYAQVNLWGASYGTRVALEWLRRHPQTVRTAVLDGVAPPDMALPASLTRDAAVALDAVLDRCAATPACAARHPDAGGALERLLRRVDAGLVVTVADPMSGAPHRVPIDRRALAALVRGPLYVPAWSAVLPYALLQAADGDFNALVALSASLAGSLAHDFAEVMHFAVVCAEDVPRVDAAARAAAAATRFGTGFIDLYRDVCEQVPTRPVPAAFYAPPGADVPVLLLSGGADPATPPRHAETVARTLPRALHLVAPHAGHGVTTQPCAVDLVTRLVRTGRLDGIDGACLARAPAPPFFAPPAAPAPVGVPR